MPERIVRHLGEGFIPIVSHSQPDSPSLEVAQEGFLEPKALLGDAYLEYCLEKCREHRVEVFVPAKLMAPISDAKERFAAIGTRDHALGAYAAGGAVPSLYFALSELVGQAQPFATNFGPRKGLPHWGEVQQGERSYSDNTHDSLAKLEFFIKAKLSDFPRNIGGSYPEGLQLESKLRF